MSGPQPLRRPQTAAEPLPATSAWQPGTDAGSRRFATVGSGRRFALEGGGSLGEITIAYETWGSLNAAGDNAILVCHALTGDAHAGGRSGTGQKTAGWWDAMIGPGKPLDTDRYFIVCSNVLGSCQGTTGPASPHPEDGKPYGSRFPVVSIRDMVRAQALLADALQVNVWLSVIGGSMGGMQVLEWGVMFPHRVRSMAVIASAAAASALQIAWSQVGRLAIAQDPKWNEGDYYEAADGDGPTEGLMLARRIAQIHYRTDASFHDRFDREVVQPLDSFKMWNRFQVESYLDHHGRKLARRFDANSYLVLNKAMDLHDIARGRGGLVAAASRIECPVLVVAIDSDTLYPPRQQHDLAAALEQASKQVDLQTITSAHGHDGFLVEYTQLAPMVEQFVLDIDKAA